MGDIILVEGNNELDVALELIVPVWVGFEDSVYDGGMLPNVLVVVEGMGTGAEIARAYTDAEGHYIIDGLSYGYYDLYFSKTGYYDKTSSARTLTEVNPNRMISIRLTPLY